MLKRRTRLSLPLSGAPHGNCDEIQFSLPFVGPNGALYVVWANYNNGLTNAHDNRNQMLLAKSTDGGETFSPAVKVADHD